MFTYRLLHYSVLLATASLLTLPNLGTHSLSDVDEGVNAEAAREMMEAGTWITPLFNFELRTAKPVLLYWLQIASYSMFVVNEFAARFPSAIAAIGCILLVYELARKMFNYRTGLLAGIVLASSFEFCMIAHAATPDSVLLFFTVLTFYSFWIGSRNGSRAWFIPTGVAAGFAVLTKGHIGLFVPEAVIVVYFLWNCELRRLLDWRIIWGFTAFVLVAAPWYVVVTLESRGAWIKQFIGTENIGRFLTPMEQHSGPFYYHFVGITILSAPWSMFLLPAVWFTVKESRRTVVAEEERTVETRQAGRFLICWLMTYLIFFSFAATKLPNYVIASYSPLAIITARLLERWRSGSLAVPKWVMPVGLSVLAGIGVFTIVGLAVAGGAVTIPIGKIQVFHRLARWAWLGIIPLAGALTGSYFLWKRHKDLFLTAVAVTSVAFIGLLAAYPVDALDEFTAPKQLVNNADLRQPDRDIRIASLLWFQPSVVFYSRREVEKLETWEQAADYLATKQSAYLLVPECVWNKMQIEHPKEFVYRTIAKQWDFQKQCDVIVVTNQ